MLRPFRYHDLLAIDLQAEQGFMRGLLDEDYGRALEGDRAKTVTLEGRAVASGGLAEDDGVLFAWAVLGRDAGQVMLEATRACEAIVSRETCDVMTLCRKGFEAGARWLRLLGFSLAEDRGSEIGPDGREYEFWVRRGHG